MSNEQPGPARFPYPHSRNDCEACREHDADGMLPGEHRPTRLCRACIGNHIAWALVAIGKPVTIVPLEPDNRVYVSDLHRREEWRQ